MSGLTPMHRCCSTAFIFTYYSTTLCQIDDCHKPQTNRGGQNMLHNCWGLLLCTQPGYCKVDAATLVLTGNSGMALAIQISSGMQKCHGCCVNNTSCHFQVPWWKERSRASSRVRAVAPHRSSSLSCSQHRKAAGFPKHIPLGPFCSG